MSDERERLANTLAATATAAAKVISLGEFSDVQAQAAAMLRADGKRITALEEALKAFVTAADWATSTPDDPCADIRAIYEAQDAVGIARALLEGNDG